MAAETPSRPLYDPFATPRGQKRPNMSTVTKLVTAISNGSSIRNPHLSNIDTEKFHIGPIKMVP